ncbi:MAG: PIN domain-containing protein [Nanoarchaeota archaeon]|nr:PIN domain-containing protein [Nanoarchaeota archaeon]
MKLIFDTYAWMEYFEGSEKGKIVRKYLEDYEVLTPSVVLLELSYKADEEKWDFKKHLSFIKLNSRIIGFNDDFILSFGKVYNDTKKKVKGIGFTDIIILTSALVNEAKILTGDHHFSSFSEAVLL